MKKRYLITLLLCFFILPCTSLATYVVGIGDSITSGFGVKEEEGYLQVFCKELRIEEQLEVTCKNQAIDGITSEQLLVYLKDETFQEEIIKADYLMMSIGGNDFLKEFTSHLSTYLIEQKEYPRIIEIKNELLNNLKQIYEKLRLLNPNMDILVVPLYNPYYHYLKNNEVLIEEFNVAKEEYITLSKTQNRVTVPLLSNLLEDTRYSNVVSSDRVLDPHPNKLGHEKIATSFIELIKTKPVVMKENKLDQVFPYLYMVISIVVIIIMYIWYKNRK